MRDADTGRSRGMGTVRMASNEEAQAAINAMNEVEFEGRRIAVRVLFDKSSPAGGAGWGGGMFSLCFILRYQGSSTVAM
jgi:RNA recognition motif-containing protein